MSVPIRRRPLLSGAAALSLAMAVSACQRAAVTAPDTVAPSAAAVANTDLNLGSDTNKQLAELRSVVAHYKSLEDAAAAGYTIPVTPCLELPGVGGMGLHYGNPAYLAQAVPNYLQPELLLFEPQKNGKMRFVGVEYIIDFGLLPPTATPPVLFGQPMHADLNLGIWALHVWVGRHNPAGMFEDWNPKVSCEFAS
jgi:hypothetical protein